MNKDEVIWIYEVIRIFLNVFSPEFFWIDFSIARLPIIVSNVQLTDQYEIPIVPFVLFHLQNFCCCFCFICIFLPCCQCEVKKTQEWDGLETASSSYKWGVLPMCKSLVYTLMLHPLQSHIQFYIQVLFISEPLHRKIPISFSYQDYFFSNQCS